MHGFSKLYILAFGVAGFAAVMLVFSLISGNVPGRRGASSSRADSPQLFWRSIIGLGVVIVIGVALGLFLMSGR